MGVFFEPRSAEPKIREAILESVRAAPGNEEAAQGVAAQKASEAATAIRADKEFKTGRFVGALIIFGAIAAVAWYAEIRDLETATEALWGIATTASGVVLGFVGGEAAGGT
jgi:hypothetical protein